MNILTIKPCNIYNYNYYHSQFCYKHFNLRVSNNNVPYLFQNALLKPCTPMKVTRAKKLVMRASNGDNEEEIETKSEKRGFLSLEEAGLIEICGLNTHERFLCRLTISSLNLLKVIADQEGSIIEELNAGKVCDWFLKDKLKRKQNIGTAVLQWDDDDPFEDFI